MWYLIVSIPDLCTFTYFELGVVSSKIYDKRDFNFETANFPCLDVDISQRIHFDRMCSNVRNKTTKTNN